MFRRVLLMLALVALALGMVGPVLAQDGGTVYIVQPGDTLYSIARRYSVTVSALAAANGIVDPSRIYAGQYLVIPVSSTTTPTTTTTTTITATATGQVHIVQPGENLFRISLRYGVTVSALAAANGIADPSRIYVGQRLVIPAGGTPGTTTGVAASTGATQVTPGSSTTTITLDGRPVPAGLSRPNDEEDRAVFEAKREHYRQYVVDAQNILVALQISDIRYGAYWATMKLNLRNVAVFPAIASGHYQVGSGNALGVVGHAIGPGGIPVPHASGMWGFIVHMVDGRVLHAYAGCRHVAPRDFDCGDEYKVSPGADVAPGGAANSELVVYFAVPWEIADPNEMGTGNHIHYMELFAYYPDGRPTGVLLRIDMP